MSLPLQVTGDGQLGIGHSGIGVPAFGHRLRQSGSENFLPLSLEFKVGLSGPLNRG
ncbi:MAG: hypothetical protein NTX20_01000 [Verrucomicrobia bacterium]|nr:hypothetical protein [Verrucomicrobiota bacterium]